MNPVVNKKKKNPKPLITFLLCWLVPELQFKMWYMHTHTVVVQSVPHTWQSQN